MLLLQLLHSCGNDDNNDENEQLQEMLNNQLTMPGIANTAFSFLF